MKICNKCKQKLNSNHFYYHPQNSDRLEGICKECKKIRCREWRDKNRDKLREIQKRKYNLLQN